jgi:hypothetical protein
MSGLTDAVDTANSIVDTVQSIANNPLISLIGIVVPQANAVIDVIRRYGPIIDRAQPVIKAAVEAGEPVFDSVIAQLPTFGKVVAKLTALMPTSANMDPGKAIENLARVLGGFHKMTFEEEQRWMNSMTPGNDPSQENSRQGSG